MRRAAILLLASGCRYILGIDDPAPIDADGLGACIEREPAAAAYNHVIGPGGPLAGEPCLTCHHDATAPPFDFAGTVFSTSGVAEAGVHLRLRDIEDRIQIVATDEAGNFYVPADTGMMFPVFADVSDCPTVIRMGGQLLDKTQGNCNACHDGNLTARINLGR
jgi:hypothetical protein